MPCDLILDSRALLSGQTTSLHAHFSATPQSAALARAMVRSALADLPHVEDDIVWAAELLTSELVTNAIIHSGTHVSVGVASDEHRLLLAVADGSAEASPVDPSSRVVDEDESGRGMLLIASVADDFGWWVNPEGRGKTIWVMLEFDRRHGEV